jgi:E3 ubiquitin-protein ligase HUWE1
MYFKSNPANILTEEQAQYKIFLFEPDLVATLVAHMSDPIIDIQFAALAALDSVSHFRSKLSESLTALNAGANHGILMQTMRKVLASFNNNTQTYTQELIDLFFSFVSFIINTSSGGQMIISAGLVNVLTTALATRSLPHLKNIAKCAVMIDTIIYGFPASLNIFMTAGGVDTLVLRIHEELETCLKIGGEFDETHLDSLVLDPGAHPKNKELLARMPALRAMLKLVLHLMQSSGSADGMRNLIDSTLPKSLLLVFDNSKLCGHVGAFGLAVNIMSTFIHNEPTSLTILQEQNLPRSFLTASKRPLAVSAEVISALPNAFGAICLNAAGLEEFEREYPIDAYLSTFTKQEHLRTLLDNDVPHLIGNSMDEFMRHHPSLKEKVMKSIVTLLGDVVALGREMTPLDSENSRMLTTDTAPSDKDEGDARMSLFIDVTSRFMEGLFQNTGHCKDFTKMGGVPLLISIFALPTIPFDFAESPSSYSLSYLFRVVVESNAAESIGFLVTELEKALEKVKPLLENAGSESMLYKYISVKDGDENLDEAQRVFSGMIAVKCLVRLLTDLYCAHSLSHTKSVNAIIQNFSGANDQVLKKLTDLKRYLILIVGFAHGSSSRFRNLCPRNGWRRRTMKR